MWWVCPKCGRINTRFHNSTIFGLICWGCENEIILWKPSLEKDEK
jgi:hypothetical protein